MTTAAVRRWMFALFFSAVILATRLPFAPHQLVTFDDVNLAYSIGHFDIRISQPQPPGYPLFVMEMRALSRLRFRRAENILLTLALAGSIAALLLPSVALSVTMFDHRGWYYHGPGWSGQILDDVNGGLGLTSLAHIQDTLATDDHAIREAKRLTAERPRTTVSVWEQGLVTWRKLAYYAPQIPIAVLEHRHIRGGAPVISLWTGPLREKARRIEARAGERIVWLLNPRTEFYAMVQRQFAPRAAGSVLYPDLPAEHGSRTPDEYELRW